ncbi:MAG: AsmA family protein [Acidobacteriia bacterium]|nr:AsmA family protein [Terriglobia bacterium]
MATTNSPSAPSRSFPLWGKIILSLVVLLVVIALALPYFLDVDRYRDTIAEAIGKQTGRKVTLGQLRARILPGVGLTVAGLHIGNPNGFPEGDVVSADEIDVNVALGPLLSRVVHVNSVNLVHPKVSLLTNATGKDNYTFTSDTPAQAAPASSSSSVSLDQIDAISLTNAEVLVGSVTRGAIVPTADTKGINLTLHNFAITPMRVHDWQAESQLSGVTLTLEGFSEPVSFQSGKVTLAGGKMDAQFVADLVKASDVKGTLSVPDIEHPQVNFELSASQLDIDKLIAVAGGGSTSSAPAPAAPPARAPAAKPASAGAPPAPASGHGELIAKGHINVEKITTKPYTVGPANIEMRVYTDRAELFPISIGMYGGTLQISSRVDRSSDPPRFTANVQMRNLDVAKVLEVTPAARGKMGGTGELDAALGGSLSDAWKKTLSGSGKFAVRNGHLPGVNLAGMAQSLAKASGIGSDTPFSVLEGDFTIADQQVASKLIHLDSQAGVVDLKGSLGLDSTLNYQGSATVNPAAALGSGTAGQIVGGLIGSRVGKITVPFALAGTIDSPKVSPGKGIPGIGAPASATGSAPGAAPSGQALTPQNAVGALKGLFGKKK